VACSQCSLVGLQYKLLKQKRAQFLSGVRDFECMTVYTCMIAQLSAMLSDQVAQIVIQSLAIGTRKAKEVVYSVTCRVDRRELAQLGV